MCQFRAFENCYSLDGTLVLPEKLQFLGKYAFKGCDFKGEVNLPASLTEIYEGAFVSCGIRALTVDARNPQYCSRDGIIYSRDLKTMVACPGGKTGPLRIPREVESILDYACLDCKKLTGALKLPAGLKSIGIAAFAGTGLTGSVVLPDQLEDLGKAAFKNSTGLDGYVYLPDSLHVNNADQNIGKGAFEGCTGLTGLKGEPRPGFAIDIGRNAFRNCTGFTGDLELPLSISKVRSGVFAGCSGITGNVMIPEGLKTVETGAFAGCGGTGFSVAPGNQNFSACGPMLLASRGAELISCLTGAQGQLYLPDLGHQWNQPSYLWNESRTMCTAKRVCARDLSHVETTIATVTEENGAFTAEFQADWAETQTMTDMGAAQQFTDIPRDAWFFEPVDFVFRNQLFSGMSDTIFKPNGSMTRAMLVTVLWRYEGRPQGGENLFTDVPEDMWFRDAAAWAARNGIVSGVSPGRFNPNGKITREQMSAIFFRYANRAQVATILMRFI